METGRGRLASRNELKMRSRNRIRVHRVERGLSLRELAAILGISRMDMTKIDAGERQIDEALQTAIAQALDIDPKEIDYAVDHSDKR
jgi:transcriptional regulator with XRE-family HTH domain